MSAYQPSLSRSPRRAASSADAAWSTGTTSIPSRPIPGGRRRDAVREQDHRAAETTATEVERLEHRLRAADADVDERDLEPALAADARGGGAGRLPLVLDPELVERRLEHRLQLARARRPARGSGRR